MARPVLVLLALALTGCTAATPPASGPGPSPPQGDVPGTLVDDAPPFPPATQAHLDDGTPVTLDPRERELTVGDETAFAGVGPTHVAIGNGGRVYVTDTGGGSVLYFRTRPRLELVRRAAVPGRPYGTVMDPERRRLWATLTARNEAVAVTADGAPRIRGRFDTIRGPEAITAGRDGTLYVRGRGGEIQAVPSDLHSPGE